MEKSKHIIHKGELILFIFSSLILIILIGSVVINKQEASNQQTSLIAYLPAQKILFASEFEKGSSGSVFNQTVENKKVVYLTFDDGPSSEADKLLDILTKYNAKATFFMLGPKMQRNPEAVQRMAREQFGIGLHGITHDAHQIYRSKTAPVKEMTEAQSILHKVSGIQSEMIRLPYGSIPYLTDDMRELLDKKNFKIWDWNVDSQDWKLKDKRFVDQTIDSIRKLERAGKTPVVLMHDKSETIQHLPALLSYLQWEGYETKNLTNEVPPLTFKCEGRCRSISI